MRKRFILLAFALISSLIFINGYFNKAKSNASGAPAYTTGSPGDGSSCTSCHGGHPTFSGRGTITTNIPSGGYTSNTSYTITATLYSPALVRGGFELSPQNSSGTILGTITAGSNTQVASGTTGYITHKSSSNTATSGTITWTMNWKAPATGQGPVTFYAAFNRSNDNNNTNGDSIFLTTLTVSENTCGGSAPAAPGSITGSTTPCSGSSVTYSVAAVTGATSYTWTLPNGWTGTSTTNSITVTTGSAGGTIGVTANNTCGSSSASTQAVTVTSSSTPAVSIATGSQTICAGSNVTFTATPTNGGTAPTYQWKANGTAIGGATGSSYSSTALTNGEVISVQLTSNAACVTSTTANSNNITMTVNPSVTPSVAISSSAGNSICTGQSVTLTATPTNGGSAPTYQWYKNGTAIGGATSATYTTTTIANNDSIYVIVTSNATCATPATATSNGIRFTTVSNATPSVSITSSAGSSFCSGTSTTFTATPVYGGTAPTYQWKSNGANINGATGSTYTSNSLTNNDTISVVMTSNSACVSTTQATSNKIIISITTTSSPTVTISSNQGTSICSGANVTFTANPTNGGSTPTYQWLANNSPVSGANSSTYSSSSLSNGESISVSMTSSSSCASPATATSNTLVMNVSTSVTAAVGVSSSLGNSICIGQNPTFTASPSNGGPSPAYQWLLNGTSIGGATSGTYTPSSLTNGDVISVQMTSNAQCVNQNVVTSPPDTMIVSAGGAPTVTISSNSGTSICQGTTVTYTAVLTLGGATPAYQWTKNGNHVGASSNTYIDNAIVNGDVIECLITSSLSCASPATASSNNLTMVVNTPPAASITASNDTLMSAAATAYQWYDNNIAISGATSQDYVAPGNGNYSVVITDAAGCQNTASYTYVTGINSVSALGNLKVYPNPADNMLFIDLSAVSATGRVLIKLFDFSGQALINNENEQVEGGKASLDLQNLPGGIYLLAVTQGSETAYRKVVVSK